jgi:methionine-rich copper-binding protein CopC
MNHPCKVWRHSFGTVLIAFSFGLAPVVAFAHAHLHHSNPKADSTVKTMPSEVVLEFSEAIEPAFTKVEITDSAGTSLAGKSSADAKNGKILHVPVQGTAQPGKVMVKWSATSVDTHRSKGQFSFTLGRK